MLGETARRTRRHVTAVLKRRPVSSSRFSMRMITGTTSAWRNCTSDSPARNRGIEAASGEFVAFLDADDYWDNECLEKLHVGLADPEAGLAYCGWQNIGAPDKRGEPFIPPDYECMDKVETFLKAASPWPIHAALVRRGVLEAVGGFDEQWPTCMDYDLWLRIGARLHEPHGCKGEYE